MSVETITSFPEFEDKVLQSNGVTVAIPYSEGLYPYGLAQLIDDVIQVHAAAKWYKVDVLSIPEVGPILNIDLQTPTVVAFTDGRFFGQADGQNFEGIHKMMAQALAGEAFEP